MIAQIEICNEYGKDTKSGINIMPDATDEANVVFAHSVQDALDWLKAIPLFADADVADLTDSRYLVTSKWIAYNDMFSALLMPENNQQHGAKYTRQRAVIYPRNTLYESAGYKVPAAD